jgi:predicted PurR-regulated permease PerM
MPSSQRKHTSVAKNTLIVLAIVATALFLWHIKGALLIAFAGVILAVILGGFAGLLRNVLPISRGWSLTIVGLLFLIAGGAFSFLFGAQIANEFAQLTEKLPGQVEELTETVRGWPLGEQLLGSGEEGDDTESMITEDTGGMVFAFGTTVMDVISTIVLILFIGVFFAANPEIYKKGIALLFTRERTDKVYQALEDCGAALWKWLTGQFIAMTFVGITATIGLMIIGVPLALVLGVIAGLSDFVPIVGPIFAVIPALLLAFSEGPETALYVALLYLGVQQIESNLITPLVQKKMVSIPPAMVLLSVVAFGTVFGIAGVVLATPLTVVAMVFISHFYVRGVLGKEISIPGQT